MNREQGELTMKKPFCAAVEYNYDHMITESEMRRDESPVTRRLLFETPGRAVAFATEEVLWEGTVSVKVTDERTSEVLFEEKGSFVF